MCKEATTMMAVKKIVDDSLTLCKVRSSEIVASNKYRFRECLNLYKGQHGMKSNDNGTAYNCSISSASSRVITP